MLRVLLLVLLAACVFLEGPPVVRADEPVPIVDDFELPATLPDALKVILDEDTDLRTRLNRLAGGEEIQFDYWMHERSATSRAPTAPDWIELANTYLALEPKILGEDLEVVFEPKEGGPALTFIFERIDAGLKLRTLGVY